MSTDEENSEALFDTEAERFVCGAVVAMPEVFSDCAAKVCLDDFYLGRYKKLWQRICEWQSYEDGPLSFVTMRTYLKDCGEEDEVENLLDAQNAALPAVAGPYYAGRVRERSLQRQLLKLKNQINQDVFAQKECSEVLLKVRAIVEELTGKLPASLYESLDAIKARVLNQITLRAEHPEELQGISSGLRDLDLLCSGWRPGQLILIGARPGMGKTQLSLNFLWAGQVRKPKPQIIPTVLFTLEMSKEEIVERLLSQLGEIPYEMIKNGNFQHEKDQARLKEAADKLSQLELTLLDETDNVNTVFKLETRIRALPKKPKLIVIDYLSYLKGAAKDNKNLEVEEISRDLKRLAVRMGIPIVVLSQLSRNVEARQNKRPMLSDFRDSGGVEQAADIAIFIYREPVYTPDVVPDDIAELIIAKQRNGGMGTVYTRFNLDTGIFTDCEAHWKPEYKVNDEPLATNFSHKKKKKGGTPAANNQPKDD